MRIGYEVRKNEMDGLEEWNKIKGSLKTKTKFEWNKKAKEYHKKLEKYIELDDEKDDVRKPSEYYSQHHFYYQLGRIVKRNPDPKLERLFQIAYNIGQFISVLLNENDGKKIYTEEMLDLFNRKKLYNINSYITDEEKEKINDEVSELNKNFDNNLILDLERIF